MPFKPWLLEFAEGVFLTFSASCSDPSFAAGAGMLGGAFLGVLRVGSCRASGCRISASAGREAVSSGTLLSALVFLWMGESGHSW